MADGGVPVTAQIVTVDERQPGTTYIGFPPACAVLPDGRQIRLGYIVPTGVRTTSGAG